VVLAEHTGDAEFLAARGIERTLTVEDSVSD
jgi:hypothetical protein